MEKCGDKERQKECVVVLSVYHIFLAENITIDVLVKYVDGGVCCIVTELSKAFSGAHFARVSEDYLEFYFVLYKLL